MFEQYQITKPDDEFVREIGAIDHTHLGMEDHGVFTVDLGFNFGSSHQGLGHRILAVPNTTNPDNTKFPAAGIEFLYRLMRACGVRRWETLKGTRVLVVREHSGLHAPIIGIEPLPPTEAEPFLFDDLEFD